MPRIVKLHGTSGAGKSTVGFALKGEPITVNGKVEAYFKDGIYLLGRYDSQCGGCDTLDADEQIKLLHKYAPMGDVFYEGLLMSEYYGRLGEASERYGDDHVFAFLDTPVEVCLERVRLRRLAKGNTKPFNEKNTRDRVEKIRRLQRKLKTMGRNVVVIDHTDAVNEVLELFHGT